jgi:hypothetical protein
MQYSTTTTTIMHTPFVNSQREVDTFKLQNIVDKPSFLSSTLLQKLLQQVSKLV